MSDALPLLELEIKDLTYDLQKIFKKELRKTLGKDLRKKTSALWKALRAAAPKRKDAIKPTEKVATEQRNTYGILSKKIRVSKKKDGRDIHRVLTRKERKFGFFLKKSVFHGGAYWGNFVPGTESRTIGGKKSRTLKFYNKYKKKANRGSIPGKNFWERVARQVLNTRQLENTAVKRSKQAFKKAVDTGKPETIKHDKKSKIQSARRPNG